MRQARAFLRRHGRCVAAAVLAALIASGGSLSPSPSARAQMVVLDPINLIENIISAIQSISQVAQQVEQLADEATQIENQIRVLENLATQAQTTGVPTWGDVQNWINRLAAAAQIGNALIYNMPNIADQLHARFPGYVSPTDWNAETRQWSSTTLDTLRGTLRSAGMNVSDVDSVESALRALRSANNSASGRNELLQVGNSLASLEIAEMTKMRQLLTLEINARNVWAASHTNREAAGDAALQRFLGTPGTASNPFTSQAGVNP